MFGGDQIYIVDTVTRFVAFHIFGKLMVDCCFAFIVAMIATISSYIASYMQLL